MRKLLLLSLLLFSCVEVKAYDYTQDASCVAAWLFTEGSGTQVDDSSPNTNVGTFASSGHPAWYNASLPKAYVSWAASFNGNGATDYIDCGDPASVDFGTGSFTILTWIYPTDVSATAHAVVTKDAFGQRQFELALDSPGSGKIRTTIFRDDAMITIYDTPNVEIVQDAWQHVAWIKSGNAAGASTFYVGGASKTISYFVNADFPGTMIATSSHIRIGAREYAGGEDGFAGYMTETAIFSKALNSTELNDIIDNGLKPSGGGGVTSYFMMVD